MSSIPEPKPRHTENPQKFVAADWPFLWGRTHLIQLYIPLW